MSPLEIEIALHYHCSAKDYRNGDLSAPAIKDALDMFCAQELLRKCQPSANWPRSYEPTAKLHAYVRMLESVPFPVQAFVHPENQFRRCLTQPLGNP